MRALLSSLCVFLAAPAWGAPVRETFGAATVDFSAGQVVVAGAAAADPHAPSAAVARVRAERTARQVAARRLLSALEAVPRERLGCGRSPLSPSTVDGAAARAETQSIEWSSDGSVALTLRIPLGQLAAPAGPDGGAAEARAGAVLLEPGAAGRLFAEEGGACVAAPPVFDTWAEARAALGGGAVLLRARPAAGGAVRVVALVRRAEGAGEKAAP